MNKKISLGAAIAFMAIIAALTFSLTMVFSMNNFTSMMYNVREREMMYQKLAEIDRKVREKYIEPINEGKLMDQIATGYIGGIGDQDGKYYSADEYARYIQNQEGKYIGIGIVPVADPSGYILVGEVYPESPASNAQIQKGDLIVKMDETDISVENVTEMIAQLSGEAGTKLALVIRRDKEDIAMEITRRLVEIPTVYAQYFEGNIGYVQIKNFTNATRDQLNKQLNKMVGDGVSSVIIDLRENPGGAYRAMARTLDLITPEGDIIKAQYKNGVTQVLATSDKATLGLPIVILTNENTSDTAESFAQSAKDYAGAKTVGIKTAGQGTVQEMIKLADGSAINITVAKYIAADGTVYDGDGVKADYEVKLAVEQKVDFANLSPDVDPQLKKALELAAANVKTDSAS